MKNFYVLFYIVILFIVSKANVIKEPVISIKSDEFCYDKELTIIKYIPNRIGGFSSTSTYSDCNIDRCIYNYEENIINCHETQYDKNISIPVSKVDGNCQINNTIKFEKVKLFGAHLNEENEELSWEQTNKLFVAEDIITTPIFFITKPGDSKKTSKYSIPSQKQRLEIQTSENCTLNLYYETVDVKEDY